MQIVIKPSNLPNRETATHSDSRTSRSLLAALKDKDNPDAMVRFFSLYSVFIQRVGERHNLTPEESDDLVQEVALGVLRRIDEFVPINRTGAFRKWLKKLATWRSIDMLRRTRLPVAELSINEQGEHMDPLVDLPDRDNVVETVDMNDLFEVLISRLERRVGLRDLQLFVAVVKDGAHGGDLAIQFGMSRGSVDTAVSRVRVQARAELEALGVQPGPRRAHA